MIPYLVIKVEPNHVRGTLLNMTIFFFLSQPTEIRDDELENHKVKLHLLPIQLIHQEA